jgi:hypothetical protein
MAVKKTTKKKEESATPAKAEAKETAPKKTMKAKATAPKAAAPEASATKPKAAAPKKASTPKKAAAPVKLSASQVELLKKIGGVTEAGYTLAKKAEQRSIDSLLEKKLIKKGAKDKTSGALRYHISSSGKKHIS